MDRPFHIIAAVAALALVACSQHDPEGAGPADDMPPSVTIVQAWDINHVVVVFDERVTRESAGNPAYYTVGYAGNGITALADSISPNGVKAASLHDDDRTVTLTTDSLSVADWGLIVNGVSDVHGNKIAMKVGRIFDGTDVDDVTPPEVVHQLPAVGATDVPTGTFVSVEFSEPVRAPTLIRGLDVIGEGARLVSIRYDDLLRYTCELDLLEPSREYTVALAGIQDLVGNQMPDVNWTFNTQKIRDITAPSVSSTTPRHLAVNVGTGTPLTISFSEPMNPNAVKLRPPVDFTSKRWSNGYRRLTCETTWESQTQYTVQIRPAEMRDLAGNAGRLFTLTFSTGAALESGGFAGTITGDPNSSVASNPGGGLVFAGPLSPYDLYTSVVTTVADNGTYTLPRLPAQPYYPFYVMDSNGDGLYQPNYGDAIGIYGVNIWESDLARTVDVADATISGINFKIQDPSAVYGLFSYDGIHDGTVYVGLFATDGFDPMTSVPVLSITAEWNGTWDYIINSLVTPVPPGSYYVAAFMDADRSGSFSPGSDPIGVYGGASPIAVDLTHGNDAPNTSFTLRDPVAAADAAAVRWPVTVRSSRLQPYLAADQAALSVKY